MLDSIKRWLGATPPETQAFGEQAARATSQQWTLRGVRDYERGRFDAIDGTGLEEKQLRHAYLEAVEWAEQVRPLLKA